MPTNRTTFTAKGRLTKNPKSYVTGNDNMVAGFTIAIDDDYKRNDGMWTENTIFLYVEGWGGLAESIMKRRQGEEVFVSGQIKQSRFVPEGEEKAITVTKVWASSIDLLRKPKPKEEQPGMSEEEREAYERQAAQDMSEQTGNVPF